MKDADKLLAKMRQSKTGWKPIDFQRLYEGFGFIKDERTNHTIYIHYKTGLRATIPRHTILANGYGVQAVKTIDKLKDLELESQKDD